MSSICHRFLHSRHHNASTPYTKSPCLQGLISSVAAWVAVVEAEEHLEAYTGNTQSWPPENMQHDMPSVSQKCLTLITTRLYTFRLFPAQSACVISLQAQQKDHSGVSHDYVLLCICTWERSVKAMKINTYACHGRILLKDSPGRLWWAASVTAWV